MLTEIKVSGLPEVGQLVHVHLADGKIEKGKLDKGPAMRWYCETPARFIAFGEVVAWEPIGQPAAQAASPK
jgi:hypothetical protein